MSFNVYGCYVFKAQVVATVWSFIQYKYNPVDEEKMNTVILSGFLIGAPLILTLYIADFMQNEWANK
jgi:hypothetical protein